MAHVGRGLSTCRAERPVPPKAAGLLRTSASPVGSVGQGPGGLTGISLGCGHTRVRVGSSAPGLRPGSRMHGSPGRTERLSSRRVARLASTRQEGKRRACPWRPREDGLAARGPWQARGLVVTPLPLCYASQVRSTPGEEVRDAQRCDWRETRRRSHRDCPRPGPPPDSSLCVWVLRAD